MAGDMMEGKGKGDAVEKGLDLQKDVTFWEESFCRGVVVALAVAGDTFE